MNDTLHYMKLVFQYAIDFDAAPLGSDEENEAYERLEKARCHLKALAGWKKGLIYSEHMEHLAARKVWDHCRDKFSAYLSMRSKQTYEREL